MTIINRSTFALISVLIVSACTSASSLYNNYKAGKPLESVPYKAGVELAQAGRDDTDCEIEATQRVPQNIVAETSPGYALPTNTNCNRIGTQTFCNTTGGGTIWGETTYTDTNANLRRRAYGQCMVGKGYRFVNIPACPVDRMPHGTDLYSLNGNSVFPPISRQTCYQVYESGGLTIGNG